jgi:hypothetical protein
LGKGNANAGDLVTTGGAARILNGFPQGNGSRVLVYGELLNPSGSILQVRTRAIREDTKATLIETGGMAELTLDDWAETGKSVVVRPADYRPSPDPDTPGRFKSPESSAIDRLDSEDRLQTHSLQDEAFPFRVRILVRDKSQPTPVNRPFTYRGNKAYVGLRKGDEYVIRVSYNRQRHDANRNVFYKVMVDGLSIRDQKVPRDGRPVNAAEFATKGIQVGSPTPIRLEKTSCFVLTPELGQRECELEGFYLTDQLVCPFIVTDVAQSLAAKRGLTDQIGVITVTFYEEIGKPRGDVATKPGPTRIGRKIKPVEAGEIGPCIGIVHIHYLSPQALAEL